LSNLWVIAAAVFVAVMLGIQAIHLVFFRLRSTQKSINHRLTLSKQLSGTALVLDALRRARGFADFENPTLIYLNDLLMQTGLTVNRPLLSLSVPGLITGTALSFAHTMGEFGVVLMVGGNIPGVTRTVSIDIYDKVQTSNYSSANETALLLLGLAFAILSFVYAVNRKVWIIGPAK